MEFDGTRAVSSVKECCEVSHGPIRDAEVVVDLIFPFGKDIYMASGSKPRFIIFQSR